MCESLRSERERRALGADRAARTVADPRRAYGRAELHERLVVGPSGAAGPGEGRVRNAPEAREVTRTFGVQVGGEDAGEDAGDVGVNEGGATLVGEARDRAGGVEANARKGTKTCGVGRDNAGAGRRIGDLTGERMQVASAGVISESGPRVGHVLDGRIGDVVEGGEALEKPRVVIDDAGDLRLLEHQLGDEDVVRVARAAPGEITRRAAEPSAEAPAESPSASGIDLGGAGGRRGLAAHGGNAEASAGGRTRHALDDAGRVAGDDRVRRIAPGADGSEAYDRVAADARAGENRDRAPEPDVLF